jgi:hypothetical protein
MSLVLSAARPTLLRYRSSLLQRAQSNLLPFEFLRTNNCELRTKNSFSGSVGAGAGDSLDGGGQTFFVFDV